MRTHGSSSWNARCLTEWPNGAICSRLEQDALRVSPEGRVPAEARLWCKPHERLARQRYQEILRIADETSAELIVMGVTWQKAR